VHHLVINWKSQRSDCIGQYRTIGSKNKYKLIKCVEKMIESSLQYNKLMLKNYKIIQ